MKKRFGYGYFAVVASFCLMLLIDVTPPAFGQWSIDPGVNTPVAVSAGNQRDPQIISDGAGGAIITWIDGNSSPVSIDAERINRFGDIMWKTQLVSGYVVNYTITSDGNGGAIVAWQDYRNNITNSYYSDIYAQKVNAAGQIQWTKNGVAICSAPNAQTSPRITEDGAGGAFITWTDDRADSVSSTDIFAQRVDESGNVLWKANGVVICNDTLSQTNPQIVSDGRGSAIIAWQDSRNYTSNGDDIYVQCINSNGQAQWSINGVGVCTAANDQMYPELVDNGTGGAIITWVDTRNGSSDIYAQEVDSLGNIQWSPYTGVAICNATNIQNDPVITSDGIGGAIIAWRDYRDGGVSNERIYVQRVNRNGIVQWLKDGIAISKMYDSASNPEIISDGNNGAIISWAEDGLGFRQDVYSQSLNAAGQIQWVQNGKVVSNAKNGQTQPVITSDGSGGAIITWEDERNSPVDQADYDIYAQKIDRFGYLGDANPTMNRVQDVPGDQGGYVTVSWNASPYDISPKQLITSYSIWRGVNTNVISPVLLKKTSSTGSSMTITQSADRKKYLIRKVNGIETTWELLANVQSHYLKHYSYTAKTTSDSTAKGTPYFKFFVSAQTSNKFEFWDSPVDSGYSVDNLAPNAPANVVGSAVANTVKLHWNPNTESDLGGYDVFRSSAPGFNPDTMNTYATTTDTAYTDTKPSSSGTVYYVVRAVDVHGNQSPSSNEVSIHLTAIQDNKKADLPTTFALKQNYPNPFNPTTVIPYQLASKSHVTLTIYNILGQQVATLVNSEMKAGSYQARWNARNMPSGVYIYLLRAGSFMQSRKLILIK